MSDLIPESGITQEISRLMDFHRIFISGISSAKSEPELARALRDVQKGRQGTPTLGQWDEKIERLERKAKVAQEYAESGCSYLYEMIVVKFWSILEAGIEEVSINCLKDIEGCKDLELIRSIKGPLVEFHLADSDRRADFLYSELKVITKSALKLGVGVFEAILDPLGMAGAVDDFVRRSLLELQQLRHLLVHRRGIVDKRYLDACPFSDLKVGDKLLVDEISIRKFFLVVTCYDFELQRRAHVRFGKGVPDDLISAIEIVNEKLVKFRCQ